MSNKNAFFCEKSNKKIKLRIEQQNERGIWKILNLISLGNEYCLK